MKIHLIDHQWRQSDGAALSATNPNTSDEIWAGNSATELEVDQAIASARNAFGSWSLTSIETRVEAMKRYQGVLENRKDAIADAISLSVGKPLWEAKTEAGAMIAKVDLSIRSYEQRTGTREQTGAAFTTRLTHRPHGVMAVLGPYNFPGHLPNGHIVPALMAGNTIVHKPSEYTPLVGQVLFECLLEADLPRGVINLVQGDGSTGMLLSQHNDIDGLLFTGSTRTGIALHRQFAGQPGKMLALEMGGNNPLIVHQTKDHKAAVYHTIQSAFITSGQRCTCSRRLILIDDKEGHDFLAELQRAIPNIVVDIDRHNNDAFMGPVIHNRVADMLMAEQAELISNGAKALVEMQRPMSDKPLLTPGLLDVSAVDTIADEELFGPMLQVYWAQDMANAIDLANDTKYGLSAGMITDEDSVWDQFYAHIRAGIVNRNRPLTGASGGAPFGGIGASGNHRASAFYAADYCAYPMASMLDDVASLPENLGPGISL
ncbi:MAG: succinylglutamate-semialdehyde dehydrogenase [Pseudomonadota bacterium]